MRSKLMLSIAPCAALGSPVRAQYDERPYEHPTDRFVHAGVFVRDFEPRDSNTAPDSFRIAYRRLMPAIGFRQGLVDVTFGYTRFSLRGQSKAAIVAAVTVGSEFPLLFSRPHALLVRFTVSSDYTRSDNTGSDKEAFNVGSAGMGVGLRYRAVGRELECSLSVVEAIHLSFEAFSTGTGFSATTLGEALVLLRTIPIVDGIAFGYRIRYQTWNMSNAAFDYRSLSLGAFLGFLF